MTRAGRQRATIAARPDSPPCARRGEHRAHPSRPPSPIRLQRRGSTSTSSSHALVSISARSPDPAIRESPPCPARFTARLCRAKSPRDNTHITHWAIIDTSSTDGTRDIIRREMAGLPGEFIERQWVDDFAHSRNQALDIARDQRARVA